MDPLLIIVLVVALLLIGGAGVGYYGMRRAPVVVEEAPVGASPLISLLGIVGLILLVAFFTLWLTGWHFGFQAVPPR